MTWRNNIRFYSLIIPPLAKNTKLPANIIDLDFYKMDNEFKLNCGLVKKEKSLIGIKTDNTTD
ncbi:hypothetical protein MALL_0759 [Mycoplasmopsis alligatoris A21JP2]|uniref:Uncharacterized protein n=1 Tax=Mycoplasmopsis alligatoris A21JP2 TaxID=747682 RepID=D4XW96_9BACT|nr:hypothetical protein MALL_0759 [Mycoplasmopsis alligatoris A21JP2]